MAEMPSKRQREETQIAEDDVVEEEAKRRKHSSYNHILSLLETEEDVPTQDLSSLITTLQQELTADPSPTAAGTDPEKPATAAMTAAAVEDYYIYSSATSSSSSSSSFSSFLKDEDEEEDDKEKERVIRHLLEASDDELGIPNITTGHEHQLGVGVMEDGAFGDSNNGDSGLTFPFCDGLWELEDEAANYYTLLQSELFM